MSVDLKLGDTPMLMLAGRAGGLLRNELAYVLATALWETAWTMQPVIEAYWMSEDWRLDNLDYYPWYGRGYVQLTWETNYQRADDELDLGGRLIEAPDEALRPFIAARVIVRGMREGWFSGKKLSDFIDLDHSDFVGARAIVNGDDHAQDIANLAGDYDDALLAAGYGVDGRQRYFRRHDELMSLETWARGIGYAG